MKSLARFFWPLRQVKGVFVLCLLALLLGACDSGTPTSQHQTVQTDSGSPVTYSVLPQDVLLRLFYGGGKVSKLEMTPEISIYGDGTFIIGPGLTLQKGSLSSDELQSLLHSLTSTDNLLHLQRQVFNDIPGQNATLLQANLNGQNYQFTYGPFGNLQESAQDMREYQQLGHAISTIKNAVAGSRAPYTSQRMALLVYQTFRIDYGITQDQTLPEWPLADIDLANAAIYECGMIHEDDTGPNADNGCLTYTAPLVAYLPGENDVQQLEATLKGQQAGMFLEYSNRYIVMLRPLLPDEIAHNQLAMYGSNTLAYQPVPLKGGAIPTPTPTP